MFKSKKYFLLAIVIPMSITFIVFSVAGYVSMGAFLQLSSEHIPWLQYGTKVWGMHVYHTQPMDTMTYCWNITAMLWMAFMSGYLGGKLFTTNFAKKYYKAIERYYHHA